MASVSPIQITNDSVMHQNIFPQSGFEMFPKKFMSTPSTPVTFSVKTPLENNGGDFGIEAEKELDFFASLLMDLSKGVFVVPTSTDGLYNKRKNDDMEFSPLFNKKTKRIPRSPSLNSLVGEQTIACEEHSAKHVRCPMNCPNRRLGSKRLRSLVSEESLSTVAMEPREEHENLSQEVQASVQKKEPLKLSYEPATKSYDLPKPCSSDDHIQILKWSLLQQPNLQGTLDDVFNVIKKNAWKELKQASIRDILNCKKVFQKFLDEYFENKTLENNGEPIYFSKEFLSEDSKDVILSKQGDFEPQTPRKESKKSKARSSYPEPLSPSSDISDLSPISSPSPLTPEFSGSEGAELDMGLNDDDDDSASDRRKKGRRWLRFACEKHRREHTKCGENCPSRRISYTIRAAEKLSSTLEC